MPKTIQFKVPTQDKQGQDKIETREGFLVKLYIGNYQEKFVLQHGITGRPEFLTHYASGRKIGKLLLGAAYLGSPPSPRDQAVKLLEGIIAKHGAEAVLQRMRAAPVIN